MLKFFSISHIAWVSSAWIDKSRPKAVGFVNPTGAIHVKWEILKFFLNLLIPPFNPFNNLWHDFIFVRAYKKAPSYKPTGWICS